MKTQKSDLYFNTYVLLNLDILFIVLSHNQWIQAPYAFNQLDSLSLRFCKGNIVEIENERLTWF